MIWKDNFRVCKCKFVFERQNGSGYKFLAACLNIIYVIVSKFTIGLAAVSFNEYFCVILCRERAGLFELRDVFMTLSYRETLERAFKCN